MVWSWLKLVGGCRKSDFLAGINVDSYTNPVMLAVLIFSEN